MLRLISYQGKCKSQESDCTLYLLDLAKLTRLASAKQWQEDKDMQYYGSETNKIILESNWSD